VSEKFTIEIISPDRSIIKTETSEVVIPSFEGEMGILKDHIPLITFLRPGLINIKTNTDQKFFVEEGTVEFSNNNLLILTSTAKEVTKMNKKFIDTLISESEKKLDNNEINDKERYLLSYKLETLRNINQ
jgi:ATP synthase F1 epsilon subunit